MMMFPLFSFNESQHDLITVAAFWEICLSENEIGGHTQVIRNFDDRFITNFVRPLTQKPAERTFRHSDCGGKLFLRNLTALKLTRLFYEHGPILQSRFPLVRAVRERISVAGCDWARPSVFQGAKKQF